MTSPRTRAALMVLHAYEPPTVTTLSAAVGLSRPHGVALVARMRAAGLVKPGGLHPSGRLPTRSLTAVESRVLGFVTVRAEQGIATTRRAVELASSLSERQARDVIARLRSVLALDPPGTLRLTTTGEQAAERSARDVTDERAVLAVVSSFPGMLLDEVAAELHTSSRVVADHIAALRRDRMVAPDHLEPVTTSPLRWPRLSGPSHVALVAICRAWDDGSPLSARDLRRRLAWSKDTMRHTLGELRRGEVVRPERLRATPAGDRAARAPLTQRKGVA